MERPGPRQQLDALIRQRQQGRKRPPAEQWIADQPGVGGPMLDTLRAISRKPLAFDTATASSEIWGSYQRGGDSARIIINPVPVNYAIALDWMTPGKAEEQAPLTLAHELFGHGFDLFGSDDEEDRAEMRGSAFLRLSGRDPQRRMEGSQGMTEHAFVRDLLDHLTPAPKEKK